MTTTLTEPTDPYGDPIPAELVITRRMHAAAQSAGQWNMQSAYQRSILVAIQKLEAAVVELREATAAPK